MQILSETDTFYGKHLATWRPLRESELRLEEACRDGKADCAAYLRKW